MTFDEFIALDLNKQKALLAENAVYLSYARNKKYKLLLYQVNTFYIEVWYHLKLKRIVRYRPFTSTHELAPYLVNIDIDSLIEM